MKLRSMICLSALATAFAAFGTAGDVVVSGSTCAAMAVPVSATYTLIAVPFKNVASASQVITVKDFVKTVGLKANSKLYYYDGSQFLSWNLEADDVGPWKGSAVSKSDGNGGTITADGGTDAYTIPTGSTLWLERSDSSITSVTLYGEDVDWSSAKAYSANSLFLISNPKETDKTIGNDIGSDGDMILIPSDNGTQDAYTRKGGVWKKPSGSKTVGSGASEVTITTYEAASPIILGGRGAWYVSKGATAPTIAW